MRKGQIVLCGLMVIGLSAGFLGFLLTAVLDPRPWTLLLEASVTAGCGITAAHAFGLLRRGSGK